VKFAKCNIDDNPVTPSQFEVKAIPTLIFFKGGSEDLVLVLPQTASQTQSVGNNFTFQYPQKYNITSRDIEGGGKQILVESTEPKKGFEIDIIPFDESTPLTADRIKQDLPDIVMSDITNFTVSTSISGLSFNSADDNIGSTHEVWFIAGGALYQCRTYRDFGPAMEEMLKTFKFK